jgi:hypothetical protein
VAGEREHRHEADARAAPGGQMRSCTASINWSRGIAGHSPGPSKTDTAHRRSSAPSPSPAAVLSIPLNRYYGRLRRLPGQPSTSRGHQLQDATLRRGASANTAFCSHMGENGRVTRVGWTQEEPGDIEQVVSMLLARRIRQPMRSSPLWQFSRYHCNACGTSRKFPYLDGVTL